MRVLAALALLLWGAGAGHLLASEAPQGQSGGGPGPEDRVLVRVNGHAIMASELDRVLGARVPALTGHGSISPERMALHRKQLLQEIVMQRLELDEAHRLGITVGDAEVARAEAELKARFPDADAYVRAIAAQGLDPKAIRTGLAEHLLGGKVEAQVKARVPEPTPAELKAYHAEHPEKFRIPARADITYVLAPVDPAAPPADWTQAKAKVAALKERIKGGEPFAQVAAAARDDPGFKVVPLGLIHQGQSDIAEIDRAAFAEGAGSDSDPVWTLYGYVLIHVEKRQPGRQLAFDELNLDLFKREWRLAREGEAMRAWVTDLMAHADLKFGDAAAAAETAAPEAAAAAPAAGVRGAGE